jgi:serine/threonine protein kinase
MILGGAHASVADRLRFMAEAEAIARLQHPHIVQVYEVGEHGGLPYFSLEFCAGGSLAKKLGGVPLPPKEAASLVEKLAHGMHAAHRKDVIHRDLKPGNVLLTEDGTPKVTDFGLAKRLDEDQGLTFTGALLGTPCYMAPEQAAGNTREVGPRTDVYALGAVLYETLTGRPPFRGATRELTIGQVLSDEPVPPTHRRSEVPRELEAVCLKCLEKEQSRRYASAADLAEDLRRFLSGESISATPERDEARMARVWRRAGFEFLGVAARAGVGIIYKARQVSLDRVVAVKMILGDGSSQRSAEMAAYLSKAARAVASLQHPNIVQIIDFGELQGQPYYTMEFIEDNLHRRIADTLPSPRWAAGVVERLARALHQAHLKGIVHRDLKPAHVLLTADGTPKLTGFGLVRLLGPGMGEVEKEGEIRGTPCYMAPEQARGQVARIGPTTDVYGLGAILYDLLTAQRPFLGATIQDTLQKVMAEEPVPPSRLRPKVPTGLEAICLRCLRKDPGRRYPSAEALADDLQAFLTPAPLGIWRRVVHWVSRR